MANTVITHPAQKLKIKHIKGSHFKLVVNVKNSDGGNYSFQGAGTGNINTYTNTAFDLATFKVFDSSGGDMQIVLAGGAIASANSVLNTTVEDGKITINYDGAGNSFSPSAGKYKYTLVTSWNFGQSAEQTVFLYGDFIVEDIQPYSSLSYDGV